MFIEHAAATHHGRLVERNEDCHDILPSARLFVVADGIGSAPYGARASQLAVETVTDFFRRLEPFSPSRPDGAPSSPGSRLRAAFETANARVWEANRMADPLFRMGTTLLAAQFLADEVTIASVGDSRCYRWRRRELSQLTRDHLILEESRPHVTPSEYEALRPLQQSVLSRSIGRGATIPIDVSSHALEPDDVYLLCSNGLTDALPTSVIAEILDGAGSLSEVAATLVRTANASCGRDNTTTILVRVGRPPQ